MVLSVAPSRLIAPGEAGLPGQRSYGDSTTAIAGVFFVVFVPSW
jgi:hypothetical protein